MLNRTRRCLPLDGVLPHPPTVYAAPPFHSVPAWGWSESALAVDPNFAPTHAAWQPFTWNQDRNHQGRDPEPTPWEPSRRPRSPSPPSSDSNPDPESYLQSYAQASSSFKGGTTVNATASVWDPTHPSNPLATRSLTVGLDSYSDVTVAHRSIVYDVRAISERLSTGGGPTEYTEEGFVDLVDGPYSFRTIPALVASHFSHLPKKCMILLGVPQLNDLDIQVDLHHKTRGLPLASYDPQLDFSADTRLQCRLSEKDLLALAEHHHDVPVGTVKYTYLDVVYFDGLAPDELEQLRHVSKKYQSVFDATKGGLPALANHPPVSLNFKEHWKHVFVPVPK